MKTVVIDKEILKQQIVDNFTISDIAKIYDVSTKYISITLKNYQLYDLYLVFKHKRRNKTCEICGITNERVHKNQKTNQILCEYHEEQIRKYGKIVSIQTKMNEYIINGNITKIIIYRNNNTEITEVLIDTEDLEKIKRYQWRVTNNNYIEAYGLNHFLIHRYLLNTPSNMLVDHKNRNTLDNRKLNLRNCNYAENSRNKSKAKNNNSGNLGIFTLESESFKYYHAAICVNNNRIYLGKYKLKEDAIKARERAELKYFKDFAPCLYGNEQNEL